MLALDVSLYVVVMVLSAMSAFALASKAWCRRTVVVWAVVALAVTATVIYLTYHPGAGYLFWEEKG